VTCRAGVRSGRPAFAERESADRTAIGEERAQRTRESVGRGERRFYFQASWFSSDRCAGRRICFADEEIAADHQLLRELVEDYLRKHATEVFSPEKRGVGSASPIGGSAGGGSKPETLMGIVFGTRGHLVVIGG